MVREFGEHCLGVMLCGSWARGTPSRTSDVDLLLVTAFNWSQRRYKRVSGRDLDIFVEARGRLLASLENKRDPIRATMVAEGKILVDPYGEILTLQSKAQRAIQLQRQVTFRDFREARDLQRKLAGTVSEPEFSIAAARLVMASARSVARSRKSSATQLPMDELSEMFARFPEASSAVSKLMDQSAAPSTRIESAQVLVEATAPKLPSGDVIVRGRKQYA